jgi:hypothetical protein
MTLATRRISLAAATLLAAVGFVAASIGSSHASAAGASQRTVVASVTWGHPHH